MTEELEDLGLETLEGLPLPMDEPLWIQLWERNLTHIGLFSIFLLAVLAYLIFRGTLARHPLWRDRAKNAVLIVSVLYVGLYLGTQPATTYLVIAAQNLVRGNYSLTFYMMDPFIFLSFVFIGVTVFVWGRGAFCGLLCPYGALLELAHKMVHRLTPKGTSFQLPLRFHEKLVYVKYILFFLIMAVSFYNFILAEFLAEVEPFKTFVLHLNRDWYFVGYLLATLVISVVIYRFFCRYVCPLGGALALPSFLRIFPLVKLKRYDYCGTCRICERGCQPMAIQRDGSINHRECLQCLDCQVMYYDDTVCPVLIREAKEGAEFGGKDDSSAHPQASLPTPNAGLRTFGLVPFLCAILLLILPAQALAATLTVGRDAATLGEALKRASPGDTIEVPEGVYRERLVIEKPVHIKALGKAVIHGGGDGPVIRVKATGVTLEGLTVTGSAVSPDRRGAGIYVEKGAHGAAIRGNRLEGVNYGIWAHAVEGIQILDNRVDGMVNVDVEARGNCIYLTDAPQAVVRGNTLNHCRDGIYMEITHGATVEANAIRNSRYAIHTMWCDRGIFDDNRMDDNLVGLALMYSKKSRVAGNRACGNRTVGIILLQAVRSRIVDNTLVGNTKGFFVYDALGNTLTGNLLMANNMGIHYWGGSEENRVTGNSMIRNEIQVKYIASQGDQWDGNYWSDYLGWDLGRDGIGDVPYESNTLVDAILWRYPLAKLLMASPALQALWVVEKQFPLFRAAKVRDTQPAMAPWHKDWQKVREACPQTPTRYYGEMGKIPNMPGGS